MPHLTQDEPEVPSGMTEEPAPETLVEFEFARRFPWRHVADPTLPPGALRLLLVAYQLADAAAARQRCPRSRAWFHLSLGEMAARVGVPVSRAAARAGGHGRDLKATKRRRRLLLDRGLLVERERGAADAGRPAWFRVPDDAAPREHVGFVETVLAAWPELGDAAFRLYLLHRRREAEEGQTEHELPWGDAARAAALPATTAKAAAALLLRLRLVERVDRGGGGLAGLWRVRPLPEALREFGHRGLRVGRRRIALALRRPISLRRPERAGAVETEPAPDARPGAAAVSPYSNSSN